MRRVRRDGDEFAICLDTFYRIDIVKLGKIASFTSPSPSRLCFIWLYSSFLFVYIVSLHIVMTRSQ